ncbi:hypothetical protein PIB30_060061 [Stylosanthes scabra]|uniref:Uncharacterized protein n=1 Tax=Stylosanthes scabra TaxID=79078 RepID=A0ABU6QL31_9FABA|nr:hypothetical protein [Stylosanthes scabra]
MGQMKLGGAHWSNRYGDGVLGMLNGVGEPHRNALNLKSRYGLSFGKGVDSSMEESTQAFKIYGFQALRVDSGIIFPASNNNELSGRWGVTNVIADVRSESDPRYIRDRSDTGLSSGRQAKHRHMFRCLEVSRKYRGYKSLMYV